MPDSGSLVAITGLPDRNACLARARALAGAGRRPAVLWLDVDRFQAINRTLGHAGGDEVLREIGRRIRAAVPAEAVPFNVGADEFVVLLPDADRARAEALARALIAAIRKPLPLGTVLLHPSTGIGVALPEPGEDPAELLARADRAKHDAKEQGRGHLVFSGEERVLGLQGALLEREELQVEHDLHEALDGGMLQLHYQPIVRPDGSVEAAEALMRCTVHGRSTRPDVLVRVAEKTGLIQRLGEWSLVEAARYARQLHEEGMPTRIAVNLSAAQLRAPSFSGSLQAAVAVAGIDASLLELEVTESLALSNTDDALSTAREVQANIEVCASLGNPLAIDDFGTGQSCLAKLKHLPASKLKLDRAFASELPDDRRTFAIVRFVAQLGREFGMTVVAEGVETAEQLACLWEAGIDAAQGYYFARPMPADAFTTWLRQRPR